MSISTELPLRCPTCGEACGFGEHLSSVRSCQKFCLTPRRSSEGGLMSLYAQRESDRPLRLELLDALSLARPLRKILIQRDSPPSLSPVLAVAVSSRATEAEADAGHAVAQLGVPWLGRLALEARLQQLALEVQERVSLKLEALQDEVKRRSTEVRRARKESERMHREKRQAEERAAELERQVDISVEMLASLRYELRERDEQLRRKQQEVCELDRFVRDTALQEASAKIRLQRFIEDLLERAERAETQLQNFHDDRSYSVSGMSRRSAHLSDHRVAQHYRYERRPRTLSVGSGGCEGHWDGRQYQHIMCGAIEGPDSGSDSPWMIQRTHADADSDNWSASDPVGQEVIWALGAGCRDITTLRIAPLQPCLQPSRFSNRCLQTIGRCWPNLCRVGVGGAGCGVQGLASLVRNCVNLCELELDHMNELNQEGAAEICRDGLQQLHTLSFISTPVTAKAILHFRSEHLISSIHRD
ncbi:F-box only 41-like protein [Labeo rohita]|uniref:F-box only 41-like protein n=1 Tax=Labeo rohita TaxID=84645 RepID=A0A498LJ86_LABRO|nr:F-box only 41-like protein [Labeo rohita]